jgi:pimeloyl-ACP methyl ester carboxylesterase
MPSILVRATTPDGCDLDGAFDASAAASSSSRYDGVLMIHGTGANFYTSRLLASLVEGFTARGIAVVRANTRGHDGIATVVTAKGGMRLGAAFETVEDCRYDLAGWVQRLRELAGPRVLLLGHSLGAVKCLYAACHSANLDPAGIVAISPPRLSYAWYCHSAKGTDFLQTYQHAQERVEGRQGLTLMEVKIPLPMWISAAGYVEKYGPDERYNFMSFVRTLPCRALFTFGSLETASNIAFQQLPEDAAKLKGDVSVRVIPEADHVYTGKRVELWREIDSWL